MTNPYVTEHLRQTTSEEMARMSSIAFVSARMRQHYGPILNAEPNFEFRADGTARVWSGNGHIIELSAAEMEKWRNED